MTAVPWDSEWDDEGNAPAASAQRDYPTEAQTAFLATTDLLLERIEQELAVLRDLKGIAALAGYVGEK